MEVVYQSTYVFVSLTIKQIVNVIISVTANSFLFVELQDDKIKRLWLNLWQ